MIVYLAVNRVNQKAYVGQTVKSLPKRISLHIAAPKNPFGRALAKYGRGSFDFAIVRQCESKSEMDEVERRLISQLGCRVPVGYNVTDGGQGCFGYRHNETAKAKMRGPRKGGHSRPDTSQRNRLAIGANNPMYGRKHTAEENSLNSRLLSGKQNPRFGKVWTAEQRALISQRTREAMSRPEIRQKFLDSIRRKES